MKKAGKSTRPFMYGLNQTTYDYTVQVTNRFKRFDLVDTIPENYEWRFIILYGGQ